MSTGLPTTECMPTGLPPNSNSPDRTSPTTCSTAQRLTCACGKAPPPTRSSGSGLQAAQRVADRVHRRVDLATGDRQRRPEPHAVAAAGQQDHPPVPQSADQLVTLSTRRHAERAHESPAAHVDDPARELI